MRATTVRITKCDKPWYWYADKIGQTFEVYADVLTNRYVLKEEWPNTKYTPRCINVENCEEVCETEGEPCSV